ncbi:MAG: hypothetical protein LW878_14095 [Proteobacteria bacterium]|nr:hypothetical protein [Pseudomonadota bacterium]
MRQIGRKVPNDKKKTKGGEVQSSKLKEEIERERKKFKQERQRRQQAGAKKPTVKQMFTCTRKVYKRAKFKILSAQTVSAIETTTAQSNTLSVRADVTLSQEGV